MATAPTEMVEPKATAAPKLGTYVVVADAITVTVGKKPNGRAQYVRALKGRAIKGRPDAETIRDFLRLGSIKQVKSAEELRTIQADLRSERSRHRLTVRRASLNSGAEDDPVQPVVQDVQPVDAPANPGNIDPGNLTLDDLDSE